MGKIIGCSVLKSIEKVELIHIFPQCKGISQRESINKLKICHLLYGVIIIYYIQKAAFYDEKTDCIDLKKYYADSHP